MSKARMIGKSLAVLLLTGAVTIGTVAVVHKTQLEDRQRMHQAVKRDLEDERRKRECAENGGPCLPKAMSAA